jgi:AcrR family transcriptional regulator
MTASNEPARERLLAAAAELTYLGGISATGVDAIANAAGVTKRTLYQHFRSKDELVAASLQWRDTPALDALRRASLKRAQRDRCRPVLALFDAIGAVLQGPGIRGCAFLNASLELSDLDHPARHAARAHLDARRSLIGELLAASDVDQDPELIDELVLLADGTFAVAASRRDPTAARSARRAAARLIEHHQQQETRQCPSSTSRSPKAPTPPR